MSLTVQQSVLDFLRDAGMTTVFGNPGSTELPLFRDWPDDFRYILGLQESVALAMADGFAQASGRAAFVNLHSAAGTGHALGALFTAWKNNTPLVVTAGQQARSMQLAEPFLGAQDAALFPRPYVKWAIEPARAEDVPAAIARAHDIAMAAPRGPTFVSIPVDDWGAPAGPAPRREMIANPPPAEAAIARIAALLDGAARIAIVAGPEIDRGGGWHDGVALAEALEATVWTSTMASRGCFPESHRLFAGFLVASRAAIVEALAGHDAVLVLGAPAFTHHFETAGPAAPEGALALITADPSVASYAPKGVCAVGDVAAGIALLLERIERRPRPAGQGRDPSPPPEPATPIAPAWLMARLQALRPRDSLIVEEAPSTRRDIQAHLPIDIPDGFYATASGGLGFALPAAVGAALARPDRKVIALIGDGSMMYAIQALWTAVQHRLPVAVIVVNNRGYFALKHLARMFNTDAVGAELPGLDFIALARGMGCAGERVERHEHLDAALKRAMAAEQPWLVDVVVAPDRPIPGADAAPLAARARGP